MAEKKIKTFTLEEDITPPGEVIDPFAFEFNEYIAIAFIAPSDEDLFAVNVYVNGNLYKRYENLIPNEQYNYFHTDLDNKGNYIFKFTTEDFSGNESEGIEIPYGNIDITRPGEVVNASVFAFGDIVNYFFTTPSDEDIYAVIVYWNDEYHTTHKDLEPNKQYSYAYSFDPTKYHKFTFITEDTSGNQGYSVTVEYIPPYESPPSNVTNAKASKYNENTIRFTWKNPNDYWFEKVRIYDLEGNLLGETNKEYFILEYDTTIHQTFRLVSVDKKEAESDGVEVTFYPLIEVTGLKIKYKSEGIITVSWNPVPFPEDADCNISIYVDGKWYGSYLKHVVKADIYIDTSITHTITVYTRINDAYSDGVSAIYYPPNLSPPGEIKVSEIAFFYGENKIVIVFQSPSDEDFHHVNIYVDGEFLESVEYPRTKICFYYDETSDPTKDHVYLITTVDNDGNESEGIRLDYRFADYITPANTEMYFDVDYTELTRGDGEYQINIYVQTDDLEWH